MKPMKQQRSVFIFIAALLMILLTGCEITSRGGDDIQIIDQPAIIEVPDVVEPATEGGEAAPADNGEAAPATEGGEAAPADNGEAAPATEGGEAAPADNAEAAPATEGGEAAPADNAEAAPATEGGEAAPAEGAEAELPPADGVYVVQSGDTVGGIAQRFGVSIEDIVAANSLTSADILDVGQELQIPDAGFAETVEPAEGAGGEQIHVVRAGDTLFNIGQRYGYTVDELVSFNNLPNPNTLDIGQEIRIPAGE